MKNAMKPKLPLNCCGTFYPSDYSSWVKRRGMRRSRSNSFLILFLAVLICDFGFAIRTTGRHLSPRVIRTKYGSLRGVIISLSSRGLGDTEAFLGVPYAAPPVGKLRFMPPGTPSPWRDIKIAEKMGSVCPQRLPDISNETEALQKMGRIRLIQLRKMLPYLRNQSEDCLHLNIYTPSGGRW